MKRKLILRADGHSKIGYGHIFRVLAFGEYYIDSYECILATSHADELILSAAKNSNVSVVPLKKTEYLLPDETSKDQELSFDLHGMLTSSDIVVTDGYLFGTEYQKKIKSQGCKLVCIDDEATWHFVADVVVNPAPSIDHSIYKKENYTTIYSGQDYFVLRKRFIQLKPVTTPAHKAVYISLGGSDYFGYTKTVTEEVLKNADAIINILYSSSFSAEVIAALKQLQTQFPDRIFFYSNLSGDAVVNLIDSCTHAITSSSTVALEVISRGIKPLIGHYAQNQVNLYNGLTGSGLAYGLGSFSTMDAGSTAAYLSSTPTVQEKVGTGIASILDGLNTLRIRRATSEDCLFLFELANEPSVRAMAINPDPIQWEGHVNWFNKRLSSEGTFMFVLENDGKPVGQIRYDLDEGGWLISYSVTEKERGKRYGKLIVEKSLTLMPQAKIIAVVKSDNIASKRVFESLNFVETDSMVITGNYYVKFEYSNENR